MTPREVVDRIRGAARDVGDRYLLGVRNRRAERRIGRVAQVATSGGFDAVDMPVGEWANADKDSEQHAWTMRLSERADRIVDGRLRIFDLDDCRIGNPIDWNRDHKLGKSTPLHYAPTIDYRDPHVAGDCKFVWEPNRHHQFVVLGRAYRATGQIRYAQAVVAQLTQWLEQCPYGRGMNWRSPLEFGVRLINWVWALDLIRPSGALAADLFERVLKAAWLQMMDITRKYSRGTSANNHLIGEAAGVYIAASYFRELNEAPVWKAKAHGILCEEILAQSYPDGGTREQAVGYQVFVLQFFLLAGIVARRTGDDFPKQYWTRLRGMARYLGTLSEGGALPMFGDSDDGYVLDLDADPHDARPWLAAAAVVLDDADLAQASGGYVEACRWLFGPDSETPFGALLASSKRERLESQAFEDSGYYLLQCGRRGHDDRISVVFDCGPLGYGAIAAHGHADALSFTLRAFGEDILVDPGTYDYFSFPEWREYFRSTRAHNTAVVDGRDQSDILGLFLWGKRAEARCSSWSPSDNGGSVSGMHSGYERLPDPVVHRRQVELNGVQRNIRITDEFSTKGRHEVAIYFHVSEACIVAQAGERCFTIQAKHGSVAIMFDSRLSVEALTGNREPIAGWVSRGYHRKEAATTLVGRCAFTGDLSVRCDISVAVPGEAVAPSGSLFREDSGEQISAASVTQ